MQDPEEDDDDQQQQHPAARRCAACRYLRRRCADDCVLAPFFPASRPHRYACVHRVFGASNVARLLQSLPMAERGNAANTMAMEAYWRVQDPVYGCTGIINRLQEEIRAVQCELARTQAHLAIVVASSQQPPPPPPPPPLPSPPPPPQQQQQEEQSPPPLLDPADEFLNLDGL
uniref:LOB domain-containing protein n=1 Tax=Oryza glumipatula TaxID=40148 RepID=A0A0E0AXP1_9ORYZ